MATTGTITGTTKRAGVGLARPFTAVSLTPADATVSPSSGTTASDGTVTLTVTAVAAGTAVVRFTADGINADCAVTVAASSAPTAGTPDRLLYDLAAAGYANTATAPQWDVRYNRVAGSSGAKLGGLNDALGRSLPALLAPTSGAQPDLTGTDNTNYVATMGQTAGHYLTTATDAGFDLTAVDGTFVVVGTISGDYAASIQHPDFNNGGAFLATSLAGKMGALRWSSSDQQSVPSTTPTEQTARHTFVIHSYRTHAFGAATLPNSGGMAIVVAGSGNVYLQPFTAGAFLVSIGWLQSQSGNSAAITLRYAAWFPGGLTPAQMAIVQSYATTYHGSAAVTAKRVVLFNGDSITIGQGASDAAHRWSSLVMTRAALAGMGEMNVGRGGRYLSAIAADAPAMARAFSEPLSATPQVCVFNGGVNDYGFGSQTTTQVAQSWKDALAGWLATSSVHRAVYVPAISCDPGFVGGWDTARATIDADVRAWIAADSDRTARVFIPTVSGVAPWTNGSMNTGQPMSADGAHPNDAGNAAMATAIGPAVQSAMGL